MIRRDVAAKAGDSVDSSTTFRYSAVEGVSFGVMIVLRQSVWNNDCESPVGLLALLELVDRWCRYCA